MNMKESTKIMWENTRIVKETYNAIADQFDPLLTEENSSKTEVEFMNLFLDLLPDKSTIIDLGCGVGKHGRYCASRGHLVTGYDVSEAMINRAKQFNDQYAMEFLWIADMCDIKTEQKFDGVVAMYSLIHLTKEQTIRTFQNLSANIKKDAKIVICVLVGEGEGYCPEVLKPEMQQFYKYYQKDELVEFVKSLSIHVDTIRLWKDGDPITASNTELDYGVIGIIGTWKGEQNE